MQMVNALASSMRPPVRGLARITRRHIAIGAKQLFDTHTTCHSSLPGSLTMG
jgi:hypothetical protein